MWSKDRSHSQNGYRKFGQLLENLSGRDGRVKRSATADQQKTTAATNLRNEILKGINES